MSWVKNYAVKTRLDSLTYAIGHAINQGDSESLFQRLKEYDLILTKLRSTLTPRQLKRRLKLLERADEFKRVCDEKYVQLGLDNLEAQIEGYRNARIKKLIESGKTNGFTFLGYQDTDYSTMALSLEKLREVQAGIGTNNNRIGKIETELAIMMALNLDERLTNIYDFAEKSGDLNETENRFLRLKPNLFYSSDIQNEIWNRIYHRIEETQIAQIKSCPV